MRVDTEAISIQRFAFAETSQVVHLLTPDLGRVVVLVRGAYREKNSYQGPLDLLVRGSVRIGLVQGRELGTLTRRTVQTAYAGLRRNAARFTAARHVLSLVLETVPVGEGDRDVYRLFERALRAIETMDLARLPELVLSYDLHLLARLGLDPQLEVCVRCAGRPSRRSMSAADGGGVCLECERDRDLRVGAEALEYLRALRNRRLADVDGPPKSVMRRAEAGVRAHLGHHLERAPPPAVGAALSLQPGASAIISGRTRVRSDDETREPRSR